MESHNTTRSTLQPPGPSPSQRRVVISRMYNFCEDNFHSAKQSLFPFDRDIKSKKFTQLADFYIVLSTLGAQLFSTQLCARLPFMLFFHPGISLLFLYLPRSPAVLACGSTTIRPISLTFPTHLDPRLFWPVDRLQYGPSHLLFLPASIPGSSGLWVDYSTAHLTYFSYPPRSPALLACGSTTVQPISLTFPTRLDPRLFWPVGRLQNSPSHLLFLPASIPGCSGLWVDYRTAHLTYFSYPPRSLALLACGSTTEQPISYFSYPPRSPALLACGSTTEQPISLTFPTRLDPWLFWPVGRLQNSPSLTFPTRLDPRLLWPVGLLQYSPSRKKRHVCSSGFVTHNALITNTKRDNKLV